MGVLDNIAIGIHMLLSRLKVRAPFIRALKSVEKTQADVLMRILRDNKKTDFGKKYRLKEISSVSELRPLRTSVPPSVAGGGSPSIHSTFAEPSESVRPE